MSVIKIYCDGACATSTNRGGIGIVFLSNDILIGEYCKGFENTTNNQMELAALLIGLKSIKLEGVDEIHIYSDSMYTIGSVFENWTRRRNKRLLEQIDSILAKIRGNGISIRYSWVHGHQSDDSLDTKWNNRADELSRIASTEKL